MFWQAVFFSAANSAMAFYGLSQGRPLAAAVCVCAATLGGLVAFLLRRQPSSAWIG
jgi:hypothetical protein